MTLQEAQKAVDALDATGSPCDREKISDGYHTFKELYDHRIALFIMLCEHHVSIGEIIDHSRDAEATSEEAGIRPVWRSKLHADGSSYEGWFIMGIGKEKGEQISYHLPMSEWERTDFAETLERAPEWDGHTPAEVVERLKSL